MGVQTELLSSVLGMTLMRAIMSFKTDNSFSSGRHAPNEALQRTAAAVVHFARNQDVACGSRGR